MKFIKYILIQSILFVSLGLSAHQPDLSSTLLVEQSEGEWVLQIRGALTGFEYEIEYTFGQDSYATPEGFMELVIKHIEENMSIAANGNELDLKNGQVKLGHETSVTFEVMGMPARIQNLKVKNSSFQDISRNQSALIVLKKDFAKEQFTLNNENSHTAELKVNNDKFELVKPAEIGLSQVNSNMLYTILAGVSILIVGFFIYKNSSSNQNPTEVQ